MNEGKSLRDLLHDERTEVLYFSTKAEEPHIVLSPPDELDCKASRNHNRTPVQDYQHGNALVVFDPKNPFSINYINDLALRGSSDEDPFADEDDITLVDTYYSDSDILGDTSFVGGSSDEDPFGDEAYFMSIGIFHSKGDSKVLGGRYEVHDSELGSLASARYDISMPLAPIPDSESCTWLDEWEKERFNDNATVFKGWLTLRTVG